MPQSLERSLGDILAALTGDDPEGVASAEYTAGLISKALAGGIVPGLAAELANVYNPLTYGAAGDGVADDQPAIQAALDAADDAGGGTVRLSGGTYRVESPLQIGDYTTLDMATDAIILRDHIGTGSANATIRNKQQVLEGNTNIVIRGGRIESTADNANTGKHIALRGVLHSQIRDVRIGQVWGDWAINISGSYVSVDGVHIDTGDNTDTSFQDGIHLTGGRFITISNCVIKSDDDCLSFTQDVNAFEPLEDVTVSNCAVFARGSSAIKVTVDGASGTDEHIHRLRVQGITGKGGDGAGVPINMFDETQDDRIVGVTLDGVKLDCSENGGHGCQIYDVVDVILQGVALESPQAKSFHILRCRDLKLVDCSSKTPRAANIAFDIDGCINIEVRNCRMESALGTSFKIQNSTNARLLYCQTRLPGGTSFDVATGNTPAAVNTGNVAAVT